MLRQLSEHQLCSFAPGDMATLYLPQIAPDIERACPSMVLSGLDVGGSTGALADWFLDHYAMHWTVLDNARSLLAGNVPHPRKELLRADARSIPLEAGSVDLVTMHWICHHLVGQSYRESRQYIREALAEGRRVLRPDGHLSLLENAYDGWPIDGLASWLLYQGTSSRLLRPMTRRLGANTAGVGVCYLSDRQWRRELHRAGFRVVRHRNLDTWDVPRYVRIVTGLKCIHPVHFWCAR